MTIVRYRPTRNRFRTRHNPFDQFFNQLMSSEESDEQATVNTWRPAVDITETAEAYLLDVELPGISEEDLELSVEENALTLQGEKKYPTEMESKNRYYGERCYGKFQRVIRFSDDIDRDKIEANYSNGVLSVTLPKTGDAAEKQIPVTFTN